MAKADLTAARLRELLDYDPETGVFMRKVDMGGKGRFRAGSVAGTLNSQGYWCIKIDRTTHRAHRLAWLYVHGQWPKQWIDHIDGIKTNNWIGNLREAVPSENAQNQPRTRKNSTTGFLGVSWQHGAYTAHLRLGGKTLFYKRFTTVEEASRAYLEAKAKFHPFAVQVS